MTTPEPMDRVRDRVAPIASTAGSALRKGVHRARAAAQQLAGRDDAAPADPRTQDGTGEPEGAGGRSMWVPPARMQPGTAKSSDFFDRYPRFYETSQTGAGSRRLNLRYEAIMTHNRDALDGARVLDIASHDGRWTLAALDAGAEHVTGIEAKDSLVEQAGATFEAEGIDRGRYQFVAGDVFEVLRNKSFDVDVILCLGFFYHTLRYPELLRLMADAAPRYIIVDTTVERVRSPLIRIHTEYSSGEKGAVADRYSNHADVVVGRPSMRAMTLMFGTYGYHLDRRSDWSALLRDNPGKGGVKDYRNGRRTTAMYRLRD